jgi:DNA ligase (NAD+)
MNIEGLSEATLEKFINKGWLKTFVDIYKLNQYSLEIRNMDGFGNKSYTNLWESIKKSMNVKMTNFLVALGIDQIGKGGAARLAKHFNDDIEEFFIALENDYDFTNVEDFGQLTADSLVSYYHRNYDMIMDLLDYVDILNTDNKAESVKDNPFNGAKVYATGTFVHFKKEEIKSLLESLGAEFASGYAKSLNYLIVGSIKGSSKEDKARKDGISILTEDQFLSMIGR